MALVENPMIFNKQNNDGGAGTGTPRESHLIDKRTGVVPLDETTEQAGATRNGHFDLLPTSHSTRAGTEVLKAERQYNG